MMLKRFLLLAIFNVGLAVARMINENTLSSGRVDVSIGDIIIAENVYWSIINNALSVFTGTLQVHKGGAFYITSNNNLVALTVRLFGLLNSIENNGTIAFNSVDSLTAPHYNLAGLKFINNGEIYLGGDGSIGIPTMSITAPNWSNTGLISFYQKKRTSGFLTLGFIAGAIHNTGTVCLFRQSYKQITKIRGDGCIDVGPNSNVYIANAALSVDPKQTFYMSHPNSSLKVATISSSQTFRVAGYGSGNVIGLSLPLNFFKPYSYDADTGILRLNFPLFHQNFDIGKGYNPSLFKVVTADYGIGFLPIFRGAVTYNGPVPDSATKPNNCRPCHPTLPRAPLEPPK